MYELTSGIVSATKTLLAPSVSSGGYVFSIRIFKHQRRKQLPTVKPCLRFLADSAPKNEGLATLRVMVVCSLDLGKLRTYS